MKKTIRAALAVSVALGTAAAVYAVGGQPWKENPTLLLLKSNGETVAELRILKGTKAKVEMDGQIKIKQLGNIQRATLTNSKGNAPLRIVVEGAKPIEIKADQIEFEMETPEQLRR
jgi:hypothetical protein